MSNVLRKLLGLVIACVMVTALGAQVQNTNIRPKVNSPLSRFGLGDPLEQYFVSSAGMAGLSAAHHDAYHLNILNPASLASLQSTAFEGGLDIKYSRLSERDSADNLWGGNLRYLSLGFPLLNPINRALDRESNDWDIGMSFTLAPLTQVGYDILLNDTDPELGRTTNSLKGAGGTYRLMWGNGIRYKNLSVGVNLGYLFGKITNSRLVEFTTLPSSLNTEFLDEISYGGFVWSAGMQYALTLEKAEESKQNTVGKRLTFGLYGNTANSFNTQTSRIYRRYIDLLADTIVAENDVSGTGRLPAELTVGLTYQQRNKLTLGAEVGYAGWSEYDNSAKKDPLADTWRIAAGLEFTPNIASYNNYWQKVRYRLGAIYADDPRIVNGEQFKRYALTLGMGLPIIMPRQQLSFVNAALELGRLSAPDILQETYVKLSLGFTMNDNSWFFKRKFN